MSNVILRLKQNYSCNKIKTMVPMTKRYNVMLDSRNRQRLSTSYDAKFILNTTIHARKAYIKSFAMVNLLDNVRRGSNEISVNVLGETQRANVPNGFYNPQQFTTVVNDLFRTLLNDASSEYVIYDSVTNRLIFSLPTGITLDSSRSSISSTLGLDLNTTYSGTFSGILDLSSPHYIAVVSNKLRGRVDAIYSTQDTSVVFDTGAIFQVPVTTGRSDIIYYHPENPEWLEITGPCVSAIDLKFIDPVTNLPMYDLTSYAIELSFF